MSIKHGRPQRKTYFRPAQTYQEMMERRELRRTQAREKGHTGGFMPNGGAAPRKTPIMDRLLAIQPSRRRGHQVGTLTRLRKRDRRHRAENRKREEAQRAALSQ